MHVLVNKKIKNYIFLNNFFNLLKSKSYFLIVHKHFYSIEQLTNFFEFCQKNNINFFTPKLNLINKITINDNLNSLFNGPTVIFYSSELKSLINLLKESNFKSIFIPLSFFYSSYLISINTIINNKFDKNIVNVLYNFSLKFLQQLSLYRSLMFLKFKYLSTFK